MEDTNLETIVENAVNDSPQENNPVETTTPVSAPATQTEPTNENFDPAKLTDPNLQQAYKQMQSDYTKKMQEFSQREQTFNDKFSRYDKLLPLLDALQGNNQPTQLDPVSDAIDRQLKEAGFNPEAIDQGKMVAKIVLDHIQQQNAQINEANMRSTMESRLTSSIAEATQADPRLNDESLVYDLGNGRQATFGQLVERYVASDPNWLQDPSGAIKDAVASVDALINSAKQAGKQELSTQATKKAQSFAPTQSSPQGAVNTSEINTVQDAVSQAMNDIGF